MACRPRKDTGRTMIPEILAILFYGLGDLYTTNHMKKIGERKNSKYKFKEFNPIMKIVLNIFGFNGMILAKIIILTIVLLFYPADIWITIIIGIIATLWNIRIMKKYKLV
jgi:hypothetical protein